MPEISPSPLPKKIASVPDAAYTAICAVILVLSMLHVPQRLNLTSAAVAAIGAVVVALAAIARAVVDRRAGEPVALADLAAIAVSTVIGAATAMGYEVSASPDDLAMLGSMIGMVLSRIRGAVLSRYGILGVIILIVGWPGLAHASLLGAWPGL